MGIKEHLRYTFTKKLHLIIQFFRIGTLKAKLVAVYRNFYIHIQSEAINACSAVFHNDYVEGTEERTADFAQLWQEHLYSLFRGAHPNLIRFIRVMRQELARASAQANLLNYIINAIQI